MSGSPRSPFGRVHSPLVWMPTYPIVHYCHHKVGTVWFVQVLQHMSRVTGGSLCADDETWLVGIVEL